MGVHGLWELLAPVGRRVSVETLAGKRLAIDASIWMVQFMKAMRDEKGEMVRNAHLIGFFRRICKLLYLRTKPVFVFDGGTPALKRRTVIARRRQRENAQTKIRKTAEKMLLNQVSQNLLSVPLYTVTLVLIFLYISELNVLIYALLRQLKTINLKELAKDLENQRQQQKNAVENDAKGKKVMLDDGDGSYSMQGKYDRRRVESRKDHQEKLDEMLAAAIAAEEDGNLTYNASTSGAGILSEEENSEDEQMLLPAMHGNVDPAVLASLPPSMQLDLLVQMRERLMAENRQKYQKVKKAPEKFSELQIQAYLKTVAFRREIDQVQKAAAGRGVGGVQTSRIASEANREFIFSSSFAGDKQELASARGEENGQKQQHVAQQHSFPSFVKSVAPMKTSDAATELDVDEPRNPDENIEIYKDERGRLRIRNKHMGIRMTRDIQRNLDLMKEKERTTMDPIPNTNEVDAWKNLSSIEDAEASPDINDESSKLNDQDENSMLKNALSLEISFEHIGENQNSNEDDDMFTQLVTGVPVTLCSSDNPPKEHSSPFGSDSDWEEMPVEQNGSGSRVDATFITNSTSYDGNMSHETEVEWEETPCADHRDFTVDGAAKFASKICLEEEADLREAIRRSLLDIDDKEPKLLSSEFKASMISGDAHVEENQRDAINLISENVTQLKHNANEEIKLSKEISCPESKTPLDPPLIVSDDRNELSLVSKRSMGNTPSLDGVLGELPSAHMVDEKINDVVVETSVIVSDEEDDIEAEPRTIVGDIEEDFEREPPNQTSEMMEPSNPLLESSRKRSSYDAVTEQTSIAESSYKKISSGNNHKKESFTVVNDETSQSEFRESDFEKEMLGLNEEFLSLGDEQRRLERNADSVSSEMFAECQELLQIFGLPYIIAPMEAEAQCAFMELSNLVDGVVTDDSDVFLFGGRSIYKNIFDDRKYVETYFMKDIEKELGLSRDKLIHMALLLGSDYTEGISGIGVVNAIEVVNAFPEEDGLTKFREWVESPDPAILGKADVQTGFSVKKRGSMAGDAGGISVDDMQDIKRIFMDKHRNVSKNWNIPSTFPSEVVISAYSSPQVDRSTEPFSWGKPDLSVLRKLCWEKFSWNGQKTDDLLLPVLKEYEKRETQLRMEAFYSFNERFAKIRSKRIEKAVKGITRDNLSNLTDDTLQKVSRNRKKRVRPHASEDNKSDKGLTKANGSEENQGLSMENKTSKQLRKGANKEKRNSRRTSAGNKRGRGNGRGKHDLQCESSENSSDDSIGRNEGKKLHDKDPMQPQTVRRSTRSRNPVNYNVDERPGDVDSCDNAISHEKSGELVGVEDEVVDGSVDFKGKKQHEATNTVFKGLSSRDCDQNVGEFCANEVETGGRSTNHRGDPHSEAKNGNDYLTMGGGFCMEESETAENKDAADETTCPVEDDDSLCGFDSMERPNGEICPGESTSGLRRGLERHGNPNKSNKSLSEDSALPGDVRTHTETPSTGTLIAMPFLKRKKRRR